MIIKCYTLYDRKALVYHRPFFALTDGEATRMLSELVADTNTTVGRHPADYVLYCIGGYDDSSGLMLPATPAHVVDALTLAPAPHADLFKKVPPSVDVKVV